VKVTGRGGDPGCDVCRGAGVSASPVGWVDCICIVDDRWPLRASRRFDGGMGPRPEPGQWVEAYCEVNGDGDPGFVLGVVEIVEGEDAASAFSVRVPVAWDDPDVKHHLHRCYVEGEGQTWRWPSVVTERAAGSEEGGGR
jgi:hypothetical protein